MPLPNAKGRRPAPVVAVGIPALPAAAANPSSPGGASTSTSDSSPSPNHPGGGRAVSPGMPPVPPGQTPSLPPPHKYTVTIVSPIDAGACGEVSVIRYEDTSKGKSELRVMKEMENRNKVKCDREKAQFNRQSCHPNMIKYFYYGPSCTNNKNTHTQVQMELMDLGSLKTVVESTSKKMTPEDRRILCETVGYQIFMALDYFHFFHGGMHRDVKPANILVNMQGRAKLCDFDASVSDSLIHDTGVGTTSYAAPEVIAGQPHDFKCDVWSAGTVLFELAAGKHPYMGNGGGLFAGMMASNGNISDGIDYSLVQHMPASFTALLKRCLTEDQSARFTSSEAIVHPFFDEINKGRRRDQRAETQLRKLGIDVDPDSTYKMHVSWRHYVAAAEGSSGDSFASRNSSKDSQLPQRTASSLGEEEVDDLNGTNGAAFGSPVHCTMDSSLTSLPPGSPLPPGAVPAAAITVGTPTSTPVVLLGHTPGSPEAKQKAMRVSNVMKSILYNWEHASVNRLAAWLKVKQAELKPIVTPEQLRSVTGGATE